MKQVISAAAVAAVLAFAPVYAAPAAQQAAAEMTTEQCEAALKKATTDAEKEAVYNKGCKRPEAKTSM